MKAKIQILEPYIAEKIAAGEVVERPASVVKELVENSLDAGSTKIIIEIGQSGLEYIKVTDDGEGMDKEDAQLAFIRYATSKIKSMADLSQISTLGFRGEGLPSIAAVSKVTLFSRRADNIEGFKIYLEGGIFKAKEPCGCPKGTIINVENLFYNTPARKKFLKSHLKETGLVADIVNRLALANPQVAFKLVSDERIIFQTSGNNNLLDTIAQIHNIELAKHLLKVKYDSTELSIQGYIGQSFQHRANRDLQTFFLNNRYIHHSKLSRALEASYQGALPVKRHPICVINISVPFELVDVNVHPTKLEVRISNEEKLLDTFSTIVKETLQNKSSMPTFNSVKESQPLIIKEEQKEPVSFQVDKEICKEEVAVASYLNVATLPATQDDNTSAAKFVVTTEETLELKAKQEKLPILNPIGQLFNSYILAEGEEGLYILDQHAAHERIMYEELTRKYASKEIASQMLAIPITLELSYSEATKLIENIFYFTAYGIIIEHFGGCSFQIRGLPLGFSPQDGEEIVSTLLTEMGGSSLNPILAKDKLIKLLACKKAAKANQKLALPEINHLLQQLNQADYPFTCPHGRPTIICLNKAELLKKFLRT
ncbi:DNA mismatch repair endonuclease MutL [Bacillota bacterium LX-D]|nr:DNA mismatch repair endonuclease MutL [Bacillota bacterium LX-D]